MRASLSRISAMIAIVALYPSLAGCVSSRSLDWYLDRAIGLRPDQVSYPPLDRAKVLSVDNGRVTTSYEASGARRCRWEFVSDEATQVILSWRYPDESAREACQGLARTRP